MMALKRELYNKKRNFFSEYPQQQWVQIFRLWFSIDRYSLNQYLFELFDQKVENLDIFLRSYLNPALVGQPSLKFVDLVRTIDVDRIHNMICAYSDDQRKNDIFVLFMQEYSAWKQKNTASPES
ncbi:MAG: hypothetical protein NC924_07345 [Candidatus Omnitrophica bacterium]|nr:hypothetical protein [Candidatus Omnitrophota bacterium]